MTFYVPGTTETDPKKLVMSLQQASQAVASNATDTATNTTNIATNTTNIATNTTNIASNTSSIGTINTTLTAIQGAWTAYTPTLSASAGTFTSASASGRYLMIGKTVFVAVTVTITTNGTATTSILFTLPTNYGSGVYALTGRDASAGKMLQGITFGTNKMFYVNYDNSYPGANGSVHNLSAVYESA